MHISREDSRLYLVFSIVQTQSTLNTSDVSQYQEDDVGKERKECSKYFLPKEGKNKRLALCKRSSIQAWVAARGVYHRVTIAGGTGVGHYGEHLWWTSICCKVLWST